MVRWFVAAASIFILGACGAGDGGGGSGVGGSGGGGEGGSGGTDFVVEPQDITWEPCTLEAVGSAECATLQMRLDRDDPASQKIPFFVRRIRAEGESRGQLWLLEGGPGSNGGQLPYYAQSFLLGLGLDIYMPDYRGVGRSAHLGCGTDSNSTLCMARLKNQYGEDLVRFSTSDAVRDVGEAILLLRRPGEQVFVWGTSYGTVTGHRFLHLFPDLVDGVVLDSACGAAGCDLVHSGVDGDRNARDIADLCAADAFCRGKLGADPWAKVADVLDRVEAGHCAAAVADTDPRWIRAIFAELMGPYFMPSVGMAMIARLDRCQPADAAGVAHLVRIFASSGSGWVIEDTVQQSNLLYYNIVFNEFWDPSFSREELEQLEQDLVASSGGIVYFADFYQQWPWPRFEVPADLKVWADADVPVLILNGTLDAQTRHERMIDARDAFTGPGQHVVIVPYANHGVFLGSAPSSTDPSFTCGGVITRQFLTDPTAALDLSCLEEQTPPRFDTAEYESYWFNTPDLWENVQTAKPVQGELEDPYLRSRLDEARARLQRALR